MLTQERPQTTESPQARLDRLRVAYKKYNEFVRSLPPNVKLNSQTIALGEKLKTELSEAKEVNKSITSTQVLVHPHHYRDFEEFTTPKESKKPIIKESISSANSKGEKLDWEIEFDPNKVVNMTSSEGDRKFIVVKINSKSGLRSFEQIFYKSTGKNSGSPDTWFPCDGVLEIEGEDPSWVNKSKYQNSYENGKFKRLGSPEFIADNGKILLITSYRIGLHQFEPFTTVEPRTINLELQKLSPTFQPQKLPKLN
jgi:hypothetical protein